MIRTVKVTYEMIVIYFIIVIIGDLYVALLPPLLNLPECKEEKSITQVNLSEETIEDYNMEPRDNFLGSVESIADYVQQEKISVAVQDLEEKKRMTNEHIHKRLQTSSIFARLKSSKAIENITVCSEITSPVVGVQYPWYLNIKIFLI